jgi:predicted Zn-dependent protease
LAAIGKPEEAVELVQRALVLDPGNVESRVMLGNYLLQSRRVQAALSVYRSIADDVPEDSRPWFGISDVYKRSNDFPQAAEARRKGYALAGDGDAEAAFTGKTTEDRYSEAEKTVAQSELRQLEESANTRYIHPFYFAKLLAQIGDRRKALDQLEQASKQGGHVGLMLLRVDSAWDSVLAESRFADVVRRLRIPPGFSPIPVW